ncbi:MAG: beta-N-acetylhexosaminidase [Prolixibacteraceae bacterium]|nr:beta-N-acetylhexosaminidase [Prolixibacteraceae bacterium]
MTTRVYHGRQKIVKDKSILFLIILFLITGCHSDFPSKNKNTYAIIPEPLSLVQKDGSFTFSEKSKIIVSELNSETKPAADFLAQLIKNPTGLNISVEQGKKGKSGSVFMSLDPSIENVEGYALEITPKIITVRANTAIGLFYAVQTLRQLLPVEVENEKIVEGIKLSVPACEIKDEPQFKYRGMHLDVGRHFFPVASIKRYIDMIALHKMNTFHWHLTEDQGWRIEIKKYPKLTTIGAVRKETIVGTGSEERLVFDGKPYGGFYTQEEVKDIVAYAKSRFVTIIPEIEMPGHSLAALTAYPEFSCTGGPFEVGTKWGVFPDVYCAGKEATFKFIEDVLTEVIDLFPGTYFHIGGDECPKDRWQKCPDCQKRIKNEGLKDEKELQSYFISRIERFLISKNRKLIGWDEILEGGLAPEATVMSWRGTEGGIEAARQKHHVIMSPYNDVYLYIYQCEPEGEPLAAGGYLPLEKVYAFNPVPSVLNEAEQKYILGLEGCLWSEFVDNPDLLEYMVYPRMFAIAETGWTRASKKDFNSYLSRLDIVKERYDAIGINYFKGEYRNTRAIK